MNKLRVGFIREIFGEKLKEKTILDVGCGGGILAEGLARLGASVTAIDPNQHLLDVANKRKERYQLENLNYFNFLIEDLQEIEQKFDLVVSSEVVEHVDSPWEFIAYASNLVKVCTQFQRYKGSKRV